MIREELYKNFLDFLEMQDISLCRENNNSLTLINMTEEEILNKLFLLSEFHKKTMGYKGYLGLRLDNKTGSIVEQYKVNIKRLKRYLKNIRINSANSNFERKLLKVGFDFVQKAESCISEIMKSGYMEIIGRSMKRTEICLGNTSFQGLDKVENTLVVNSIEKCCYNNVEMDCFYFLIKFRKKNIKLNYKKLVEAFCKYEELDERSSKFILTLLSYPNEFIRCSNRYREKLKEWSEEEYEAKLDIAIIKDGEALI